MPEGSRPGAAVMPPARWRMRCSTCWTSGCWAPPCSSRYGAVGRVGADNLIHV